MIVIGNSHGVERIELDNGEDMMHVTKRVLIGKKEGAENFAMRLFTVGQGGSSASHSHPWEHEVYILTGKGKVRSGSGETPFTAGDFVFVPSGENHQFLNTGSSTLEFICIVPASGEG